MNTTIYITISFAVGVVVGMLLRRSAADIADQKLGINQKQEEQKEKNLQQILDYMLQNREIDNQRVQMLLHVSDSTAERYLDELEKSGKLVQIGKTGQSVTYRIS